MYYRGAEPEVKREFIRPMMGSVILAAGHAH